MDTIPKLFWKRLEKMSLDEEWIFKIFFLTSPDLESPSDIGSFATISKSEKFEVPQWNISLNDSGIQVTLFWAEKCSSAIDSTQGINSNYCHRIIHPINGSKIVVKPYFLIENINVTLYRDRDESSESYSDNIVIYHLK